MRSNPCVEQTVGTLSCGEKVNVLGREGPWLKVKTKENQEGYIGVTFVSRKKGRFDPVDLPAPSTPYIPNCNAFRPKTGKVAAVLAYGPLAELTEQARKAHVQGVVTLLLTIGIDGKARDISVTKGLGYGLDENAVEAIKLWRWEPALEDGTPRDSKVMVEVSFGR